MSTYIVTGGAGFIGSHLTDFLIRAGHHVRVVDDLSTGHEENLDPAAEFIEGDVTDRALMGRVVEGAEGIFHLAAVASVQRSNEDWCGTHRINQSGTVAVLDAARAAGGVPVCYASSAAIYGDQGLLAIREGMRRRPMTAYGVDKLGSEMHASVAFGVHGVPTLGFRFFNVYGPRQDPNSPYSGVISIFAARILAGSTITLHGDGLQSRDFVHVSDVVRHLVGGMDALRREPQSLVLNVCTGRGTTIRMLAETLGEVAARVPMIQFGPARAGDIRVSLGDPSEAIHVLGLEARVELPEGLATLLPADMRQLMPGLAAQNSRKQPRRPTNTVAPGLTGGVAPGVAEVARFVAKAPTAR